MKQIGRFTVEAITQIRVTVRAGAVEIGDIIQPPPSDRFFMVKAVDRTLLAEDIVFITYNDGERVQYNSDFRLVVAPK